MGAETSPPPIVPYRDRPPARPGPSTRQVLERVADGMALFVLFLASVAVIQGERIQTMITIKMFIRPHAINDGLESGSVVDGYSKPKDTYLVEVYVPTDLYTVTATPDLVSGMAQYQVVKKK